MRLRAVTAACSTIAALLLLLPAAASAQEQDEAPAAADGADEPLIPDDMWALGDPIRLGLKLHLGGGGNMEADWDGAGGMDWNQDDDMEVTVGFALFGEYSILRYFSIGLDLGFYWFATDEMEDNNTDRNAWIDFSPVFKGRYPLLDNKLELYAKFLVGLTITVPSDDSEDDYGLETGAGWNVGLHFGASYEFYEGLGAFAEIGWLGHGGKSDFDGFVPLGDGDVKYETHQFALNLGVFYSL